MCTNEHKRHRKSYHVGAPDHGRQRTDNRRAASTQDLHPASGGCRRDRRTIAGGQETKIRRRGAVHVFFGVNRIRYLTPRYAGRQRSLQHDSMDGAISIQPTYFGQSLRRVSVSRQLDLDRGGASPLECPPYLPGVAGRRLISADSHNCQFGSSAEPIDKLRYLSLQSGQMSGRKLSPVDTNGRHNLGPPVQF